MAAFERMTAAERLERYPAVSDLKVVAQKRMPHFAWEYLDSGSGLETAVLENRRALDAVRFAPAAFGGDQRPVLETEIFGKTYQRPFHVAPVGLTGLMWPGAELMLAESARDNGIAYTLSTVGCETPEDVGKAAGGFGWFQLYPFADEAINRDLLTRARESGFSTLVVTGDVPVPSMRERQRRAGLRMPPKVTPRFVIDVLSHPRWALATRRRGRPAFRGLQKYLSPEELREVQAFVAAQRMGGALAMDDLKRLRDMWDGPMVLKGIMRAEDAKSALAIGADGIVVSNHGARQFDATPASITVLPQIAAAVGDKLTVLFDSGVTTGLDILRAFALGADGVFLGRAYLQGVAAFGKQGADHVTDILTADLTSNMIQLGVKSLADLRRLKRV